MTLADETTADATSLCHSEELPWAELAPGIEMKVLRIGAGGDRYTLMNRFAPGTVLPKHHHHGEVHAWTIAGEWGYQEYDWTAGPVTTSTRVREPCTPWPFRRRAPDRR